MILHAMIIDPEWDFCWPGLAHFFDLDDRAWKVAEPLLRGALGPMVDLLINPGKLYVPGAWEAMERLAAMVDRLRGKIDDITVTLDAHQIVDQAHPIWWQNSSTGQRPDPFTLLGIVGGAIQSLDPANGLAGTTYFSSNSSNDLHTWTWPTPTGTTMAHWHIKYGEPIYFVNYVRLTHYDWDDGVEF